MNVHEKKKPARAATRTGSGGDPPGTIYNNYNSENAKSQARCYDFDGAVRMEYSDGRYHIYLRGKEQGKIYDSEQMSNPRVAQTIFMSCLGTYLSSKISDYLQAKGFNRIMGCKIDLPCEECRSWKLNGEGSGCMLGLGNAGKNV